MSILWLPMEIVLDIAENLTKLKDINSLVLAHSRLKNQLEFYLYKVDAELHEGGAALWGAEKGQLRTLRKSVIAGAKIPKSDHFKTHAKGIDFVETLSPIPRYPKTHPITAAAMSGSKKCVRYLIRYGIYPHFLDDHFVTPIQAAAAKGHVEVVRMLLKHYPEVYKGAFTLRRTIKSATIFGHMKVLAVVFDYLESPKSGSGLSVELAAQIVLFEALWHNKPNAVFFALDKGADVNAKNGEAALWFVTDVAPWERVSRERRILRQEHKSKKFILGQRVCGWRQHNSDIMDAAMTGQNAELTRLMFDAGYEGPNGRVSLETCLMSMASAHWRALQFVLNAGDRPHVWPNGDWGNYAV
ncbi:uncharacterized protein N7511_007582 [Penicillium nucicola]|uniref:uncharacterized protein n=1 Tax=Penicillium nucicola TaxID=1850975 RepID=UPI00254566BB|nr:uncharacterized protein N7511_007582 [Penicillium nucicola]KAJ5753429.1 hypothetical protein N7511_007582 [Penicillium nucicola]